MKQANTGSRPAPTLFNDFGKTTKDLLTKSHSRGDEWKLESKRKPKVDGFVLNPQVSADGRISADVEYLADCGGSLKVNLTPKLLEDIKVTGTFDKFNHKLEASLLHKSNDFDFEITHNTFALPQNPIRVYEKISKRLIEFGVSSYVARFCQVGGAATYSKKEQKSNWYLGARYARGPYEISLRTSQLLSCQISAATAFSLSYSATCKPLRGNLAGELTLSQSPSCQWPAVVGVEIPCALLPGNTLKARIDRDWSWFVSYVAKFESGWSMALTLDKNFKRGVLLSYS